jgi:hypothetical protein
MSSSNNVEDWVTIADFNWLAEAQILKTALESSGIEAFIPEEHISTINPGVTGVQVRVQVRSSQVEDATALVEETQKAAASSQEKYGQEKSSPGKSSKCQTCGNTGVKVSPVGIKGFLLFILCALVMVPMKSHQKKVCAHCGNKISE